MISSDLAILVGGYCHNSSFASTHVLHCTKTGASGSNYGSGRRIDSSCEAACRLPKVRTPARPLPRASHFLVFFIYRPLCFSMDFDHISLATYDKLQSEWFKLCSRSGLGICQLADHYRQRDIASYVR
jgi:hypothetical protein